MSIKKFTAGDGSYTIERKDPVQGKVKETIRDHIGKSNINQLGYFGNIWVRSHYFAKAGDTNGEGHYHNFDHVTLLAVGSVLVEVDGHEPKEFHGPTFIVIDKNKKHKFTALTDGVVYYCVFALRDEDGGVTDIYNGDNMPYDSVPDAIWEEQQRKNLEKLDKETTFEVESKDGQETT